MRIIKRIIVGVLLIILVAISIILWDIFPVISGFGAKNLCSCVYLSGRSYESVVKDELSDFLINLGNYSINLEDSSAEGNVFGLASRKAIYKNDLGCILISEVDENQVRNFNISTQKPQLGFDPDTTNWPMGDKLPDTLYQDIDYKKLNVVLDEAFSDASLKTRGIVVVYNGNLIGERYADGFDYETPQLGWSMTKSVINALIGILVKDQLIELNQPAPVPEWSDPEDPRSGITVDQLLRMSSGLKWEEVYSRPSDANSMLWRKGDMGRFAAEKSLQHQPDQYWYYSSGTSNLLSRMIRHQVGDGKYYKFPREKLFHKLGMRSALIEMDASGTFVGSSFGWASPRDWARFGLLYLNDGVWLGERILPQGWVDYTKTPTPGAKNGQYGAHFWLNAGPMGNPELRWMPDVPPDTYSMNGFQDQRVFIIPSEELVVVRMGQTEGENFDFNGFLSSLIDCLK